LEPLVPITAVPDHVAVAVHDIEAAGHRWVDQLGGVWLSPRWNSDDFGTRQLRFSNRGKLELLEPRSPDGFAAGFLDRFGPRIHHVTLKVPDLLEAVRTVEAAGLDVVDVSLEREEWHEAFVRPSQVGGIIVQLARALHDDEGWARLAGIALPAVDPAAPALLGPTMTHTDLDVATHVWSTLGAEVAPDTDGEAIVARWGDAPLTVRVETGTVPGPRGLRLAPDPALPGDDVAGPATLPG
jgi:methylmalonyl-CoA/ethylmalonyl-CoA epimerase